MTKHWTIVHISNGEVVNKSAVIKLFAELKTGKYLIEINDHNKRSSQQNRYYHGICVPLVLRGIKDLGTELTHEETHEFLKARFNYSEIINSETGEVLQVPRSTTALNKFEFSQYVEKIQRFAAEFLGIVIPDPGVQLTIDHE